MKLPKGKKWAICITHDVDHMSHKEHGFSLGVVKFIGVSFREVTKGRRSVNSFFKSFKNCFNHHYKKDSWDCISEWAALDKKYKIPSTFFFAVNKGTGIEYDREDLKKAIKKLRGFDIGTHGQEFDNFEGVRKEFEVMESILGKKPVGIRTHYLRFTKDTPRYLMNAGYEYDTSEYSERLKQPYRIGKIIEIPLHVLDTYLFSPFYKNLTLEQAKAYTLDMIAKVKKRKGVLSLLVHQRGLSEDFPVIREYYKWMIELINEDKTCYKVSCKEIAKWVR